MPRLKGTRNRRTDGAAILQGTLSSEEILAKIEAIDSSIAATEDQIEELGAELKEKKADLKELKKTRVEAEKQLARRKAQEDRERLLEAVAASGKSVDEILSMLQG